MSPGELVQKTRSQLAELAGAGAVSATQKTVERWKQLAGGARALGLVELAARLEALATELGQRGALAYEPSRSLAYAALSVHDFVEALASHLELSNLERQHGSH
jgi:hypothetical protein